ncbi:MAG: FmdB family zinc ribbon protein [Coriobacteriia bacterium]
MPTYDYRCSACDKNFEVSRPMGKAAAEEDCPECGAPASRVFVPVGVAFKGAGFYNTDYKRSSESAPSACPSAQAGGSCASCPAAGPAAG